MGLTRRATSQCIYTLRMYIPRAPTRVSDFGSGPDPKEVQRAKELCEDLLSNVREQHQRHRDNPPQRAYGGQGGNQGYSSSYGSGYGSTYGGYGGYGAGYGGQASPSAAVQSPSAAPGTGAPGAGGGATDYSAQWAQYFAQNPQAAQYYYQQAQQQPPQPIHTPSNDPPPPPPSASPPGTGGYNAVSIKNGKTLGDTDSRPQVPPPPGM